MAQPLPAFRRDLELIPVEHEGRRMVLVRDQLGLAPQGVALPAELFEVLALLDGSRHANEVSQIMAAMQAGAMVAPESLAGLVAELDQAWLLDSARFREARERIEAQFAAATTRPAAHAGGAYPAEAAELAAWVDEILARQGERSPSRPPEAVIAPHIDPAVGAAGFAAAYAPLKGAAFKRVIVLGVGHQMSGEPFSVSAKEFETPFGPIPADAEAVGLLARAGKVPPSGDPAMGLVAPTDFAHRFEHSVEYQLLFLARQLAPGFRLVPILCGWLGHFLPDYSREAYRRSAGPFLSALARLAADPQTLLVAGVDFSHIGPKFGHKRSGIELAEEARTHDLALLAALAAHDAPAFWAESARVSDRYNVCGFSALACLLEVLPACQGRILHYEMFQEAPTRSAVGFAAAHMV